MLHDICKRTDIFHNFDKHKILRSEVAANTSFLA